MAGLSVAYQATISLIANHFRSFLRRSKGLRVSPADCIRSQHMPAAMNQEQL
jgi:hypothetical protein